MSGVSSLASNTYPQILRAWSEKLAFAERNARRDLCNYICVLQWIVWPETAPTGERR